MTIRNENKVVSLGPNSGATYTKTRHSSGGNTPAALLKEGVFTENNYTCTVSEDYRGHLIVDLSPTSAIYSNMYSATAGWYAWVSPGVPSNIKPLSNLLEKFKQSDFNLAVSAGESRESWHMISDRMFSFAEALKRTKRGDLRGALRAMGSTKRPSRRAQRKLDSGDVSGSFLELHYGWAPLLRDIYAAAALTSEPEFSRHSIRTSAHSEGPDRQTFLAQMSSKSKTLKNKRTAYHIARLSTTKVSWAVRLGLTNPLSIAWELTTLSFVADWFLPIGDLIQAVEASYILPIGSYIKTDVYRTECELKLGSGDICWGISANAKARNSAVFHQRVTEMTRTVGSSTPGAIFDNVGPRQSLIDLDLSMSQVASASALLHQAFRAFRK